MFKLEVEGEMSRLRFEFNSDFKKLAFYKLTFLL